MEEKKSILEEYVDRIDVSRNELGDIILDFKIKGFFPMLDPDEDKRFLVSGQPETDWTPEDGYRVQGEEENFIINPGPVLETGPRTGSLLLLSARFP